MLHVDDLVFGYRSEPPILNGVSFRIAGHESVCLLGPNGSGKTTLLRCLLGLNSPSRGRLAWQDEDLLRLSRRRRAELLAYVPQASQLSFPYAVHDVVLMGRVARLHLGASPSRRDHAIADAALERLGIARLVHRTFQELSGGERQLVLVARALAQQARLLVLDEPASALDFANQARALGIVRELSAEGFAILMTSHAPDHAFLAASRVLMLCDGRILRDGPTAEAITQESLSTLYGTSTRVVGTGIVTSRGEIKTCIPIPEEIRLNPKEKKEER